MYAENEALVAKMKMIIVNTLFSPTALINCDGLLPDTIISLAIVQLCQQPLLLIFGGTWGRKTSILGLGKEAKWRQLANTLLVFQGVEKWMFSMAPCRCGVLGKPFSPQMD